MRYDLGGQYDIGNSPLLQFDKIQLERYLIRLVRNCNLLSSRISDCDTVDKGRTLNHRSHVGDTLASGNEEVRSTRRRHSGCVKPFSI